MKDSAILQVEFEISCGAIDTSRSPALCIQKRPSDTVYPCACRKDVTRRYVFFMVHLDFIHPQGIVLEVCPFHGTPGSHY